jgi:hypothetical protein
MTMNKHIAILGVALALAGCATHSEPKPAVCDGKHRRPANPYGTVLPTAPDPKAVTPATPGPQSSLDPKSTRPCGARA